MSDLLAYAVDLGWMQWAATISSIIYVVLAAKEQIWCWFFGLVGVTILFFIYLDARLYSDATLQVFYAMMSVYGWVTWYRSKEGHHLQIVVVPFSQHVVLIAVGAIGALCLGFFWKSFGAALPFADAFTTSFSIIATFMVARKILGNWVYWMVIDAACVVIYWVRDIPLIAILFLMYVLLAVYGYYAWKRQFALQSGIE